ncbi:hypothetical protein Btru_055818 [Bulinus truncatus]|nr:hypothetical protein Btru_055818 [Bulinus truncatus]
MDVWIKSLTLFITAVIQVSQSESNFLLTLPKVLYSGSMSEYCLTLYEDIQVTFSMQRGETTSVTLEDFYVKGQQKCNKFEVPAEGEYILVLTTPSIEEHPIILHNSTTIKVYGSKLVTFVQTDKPMYKPGQKVMFRVFTLMRNLKPRVGKIKSIFILDPNDIRVKQFLDVESKGIGSFDFQLIEEAKIGKWKVKVYLDDEEEVRDRATIGEFEVKEYVLPRFEVIITTPKYILSGNQTLVGTVCAQYTYGKPVNGLLQLELFSGMNMFAPLLGDHQQQVVKISGCYDFTFNISTKENYMYYSYKYKVNATVTEEGTGVTVHKTQDGPQITIEPLKIEIDDYTGGFFKPGLPYYGKVTVRKVDGSPAEGEQIKLSAMDRGQDLHLSAEFVTDKDGTFVYSICDELSNLTSSMQIVAEAMNLNRSSYVPRGYKQLQQWFSPSLSYIQIPQLDKPIKCGNKLSLNIMFTTRENAAVEFFYQVIARGKVVKSDQVVYSDKGESDLSTIYPNDKCLLPVSEKKSNDTSDQTPFSFRSRRWGDFYEHQKPFQEEIIRSDILADKVANFVLDLEISADMSPKFSLLIYHILHDGEVVADGKQFTVEPCFDNEVNMAFSETTVLPGHKVDIKINAESDSVCGVGIVDKSVNILGGNHQVTSEMIFKKIDEFNSVQTRDYYTEEEFCKKQMKKYQQDSKSDDDFFWSYSSRFVDATQAFEATGFKVITNLKLDTRPCSRNHQVYYVMASLETSGGDLRNLDIQNQISESKIKIERTNFPETWLWDLYVVSATGETILQQTAPHTITSWIGNALCVHEQKGLGVSPITSLKTFQPFFLSLHLPYAAVRGEKLSILFTVYNYLQKCLYIQLSLNVEKDFTMDQKEALKQPVCVCGGASHTAKIYVTPKSTGHLPVTAEATIIPGLCGNSLDVDTDYIGLSDTVIRQMFVKAEGIEQSYTSTMFMCSEDGSTKQEQLILSIPKDEEIVKGSTKGEVKIIGDIMGPALTNIDSLVRLPTGCGEQNMVGFVPNILALKYLLETRRITEDIKLKALKNMEIGYQRELTFRHKDGSYSAFGANDAQGSIWLTAFVVKSYAQAQPYIYIDEKDMEISLRYLHRSQLETGCYRETGKVLSSYMMGGLGSGKKNEESFTALTAYVVIALLTAGVNSSQPGIFAAMDCIKKDFESLKENMDPYALTLVAYANILYSPVSQTTSQVITTLEATARKEGDFKYWARKDFKPKATDSWFSYSPPSAEVEMTAYVLLAYIKLYGPTAVEKTHNIAMWLSKQRNPYGGFSSTQDTVIGLNALSEYARLAFRGGNTELKISVNGEKLKTTFSVSQRDKTTLLLQRTPIAVLPNPLNVTAEGEGCALIQFSIFYNKLSKEFKENKASFHLQVNPTHYQSNRDKCDRRSIIIRVGAKGISKEYGMALVDLKLITGWTPVAESLTMIRSRIVDIKKIEYKENEGVVSFYFDQLSRRPVEFTLDVEQDREIAVSSPKPADVKVYYYYETSIFMVQSYKIKSTCGTKQELPHIEETGENRLPSPFQTRIDPAIDTQARINPESESCPLCISVPILPQTFKEMVCSSSAAYKVIKVAGKKIKLLQDLRPTIIKKKINIIADFELPIGCSCSLVNTQGKNSVILVQNKVNAQMPVIKLDNTSVIIVELQKVTKAIRENQKTCPLKKEVAEPKKKKEKS